MWRGMEFHMSVSGTDELFVRDNFAVEGYVSGLYVCLFSMCMAVCRITREKFWTNINETWLAGGSGYTITHRLIQSSYIMTHWDYAISIDLKLRPNRKLVDNVYVATNRVVLRNFTRWPSSCRLVPFYFLILCQNFSNSHFGKTLVTWIKIELVTFYFFDIPPSIAVALHFCYYISKVPDRSVWSLGKPEKHKSLLTDLQQILVANLARWLNHLRKILFLRRSFYGFRFCKSSSFSLTRVITVNKRAARIYTRKGPTFLDSDVTPNLKNQVLSISK